MTIRAKFKCLSVKMFTPEPLVRTEYRGGEEFPVRYWTREYEFYAVKDNDTPENARYNVATPYAKLSMTVDNPEVEFIPGRDYYLDFTPAPVVVA